MGGESQDDVFIHETTILDLPCKIGKGTRVWHFSHILKGVDIGDYCNIGQNVVIGPDVRIGDRCKIQNNVSVYKGVTLDDGVFCGPGLVFTNVKNPRAEIDRKSEFQSTFVGKGATLGANATIVCGVTIGRFGFVAAGAVVTRDVPDYGLVMGSPARLLGYVCECGESLIDGVNWSQASCRICRRSYINVENGVIVRDEG